MAPERPGPEDKPGVALVQRSGAVTIPVIPVFSLPNALVHLKVLSVLCDVLSCFADIAHNSMVIKYLLSWYFTSISEQCMQRTLEM